MSKTAYTTFVSDCLKEGPQSAMERMLLEEYLQSREYSLKDLHTLPEAEARALMVEACKHASTRLARAEATANFREKIRGPG